MGQTPYQLEKRKVIFDYLEKYPDAPSTQLGRMLYRDFPEYFPNKDDARTTIRIYRGRSGGKLRNQIKSRTYYKPITE